MREKVKITGLVVGWQELVQLGLEDKAEDLRCYLTVLGSYGGFELMVVM